MSQALVERRNPRRPRTPFRKTRRPSERVRVLGAGMDLVKAEEVMHFVRAKVCAGERAVVANHNLHSLYLLRHSTEMRAFFAKADLVEVDSIPVIAWARLVHGKSRRFHRCTYLDWRDMFWSLARREGWRIYYLGGAEGVVGAARETLSARWPGLQLKGRHGYLDRSGKDDAEVVAEITAYRPHILMVGMGMPLQEAWIARNFDALPDCVVFPVGAALDYEAGVQTAAPRWLGQLGLEWAFRLLADPRRMFRRYLVEPWSLIGPALDDVLHMVRRRLHAAPPMRAPARAAHRPSMR